MTYAITAQIRTKMGKRSKDERAVMRVPAVVYGRGIDPKSISVGRSEFIRVLKTAGYSSLIDMSVDGAASTKVLIKEVQLDPLKMDPMHIDFQQVRMDEEITAEIPFKFIGESAAVKNDGGTLVKSLDQIEVRCLPGDLPHEIEVDLSKLATFEDSITIGDLKLPKGVEVTLGPTETIATVSAPLTEEQLKAMESTEAVDLSAIKTEGEEKKAAAAAKKAEEEAADEKK